MATPSTKRIFIALLLGATAIGGALAGYFYAEHEASKLALQDFYLRSALTAKIDAHLLSQLRSGETEKAIKFLSGLLEGELTSLGFYERDLPPSDRASQVYQNVAAVRAYYERFPDAERPTYGKEGLALKRQ